MSRKPNQGVQEVTSLRLWNPTDSEPWSPGNHTVYTAVSRLTGLHSPSGKMFCCIRRRGGGRSQRKEPKGPQMTGGLQRVTQESTQLPRASCERNKVTGQPGAGHPFLSPTLMAAGSQGGSNHCASVPAGVHPGRASAEGRHGLRSLPACRGRQGPGQGGPPAPQRDCAHEGSPRGAPGGAESPSAAAPQAPTQAPAAAGPPGPPPGRSHPSSWASRPSALTRGSLPHSGGRTPHGRTSP